MRLTDEDDERLERLKLRLGLTGSEVVRLLIKRADRGEPDAPAPTTPKPKAPDSPRKATASKTEPKPKGRLVGYAPDGSAIYR